MKPKLRFKGFDEDWKELNFFENFDSLKNNTLSRDYLTDNPNTGILNIHYGDILIKYGEILNSSVDKIPYVKDSNNVDINTLTSLKSGDIVMADTAEDEAVGKCVEILEHGDVQILSGLHTIPLRPKNKFSQGFLGYYLNSPSYHRTLLPLMQGIKVLSISKHSVFKTDIKHPSNLNEQKAIGEYFRKLDELIKGTGKEIEKLENLKEASLQKMFPQPGESVPQLRFKGFSEPWQEKKLGEIASIYQPLTISQSELTIAGYPVYGANGIIGYYHSYNHDKSQIAVTCRGNTCGTINFTLPKSWITGNAMVVNLDNSDQYKYFVFYFLKSRKMDSLISGSGQPQITRDPVSNFPVFIPSLHEQKAIGEYFRNLDNMISAKKKKLEKLRQVKSSCLNLMFV